MYNPFVYFEDKTIVASKAIMISDVFYNNPIYGFSVWIEGRGTPIQYCSRLEENVINKRNNFLKSLQMSLKMGG